jgi:hypothetical protein
MPRRNSDTQALLNAWLEYARLNAQAAQAYDEDRDTVDERYGAIPTIKELKRRAREQSRAERRCGGFERRT